MSEGRVEILTTDSLLDVCAERFREIMTYIAEKEAVLPVYAVLATVSPDGKPYEVPVLQMLFVPPCPKDQTVRLVRQAAAKMQAIAVLFGCEAFVVEDNENACECLVQNIETYQGHEQWSAFVRGAAGQRVVDEWKKAPGSIESQRFAPMLPERPPLMN